MVEQTDVAYRGLNRSRFLIASVLVVLISIAAFASSASTASAANHFVPVSAAHTGFGSFREGGHSISRLIRAFGYPSSRRGSEYECTLRWRKKGIKVEVTTHGLTSGPCYNGYFLSARLTKRTWHTGHRIRVGSRASKARRHAVLNCMGSHVRTNFNCLRKKGWALGLHRSECAAGRYPTVTAQIRNGRVSALYIWSHGCE